MVSVLTTLLWPVRFRRRLRRCFRKRGRMPKVEGFAFQSAHQGTFQLSKRWWTSKPRPNDKAEITAVDPDGMLSLQADASENPGRPNKSLDASGITGLVIDNLSVTELSSAASTLPLCPNLYDSLIVRTQTNSGGASRRLDSSVGTEHLGGHNFL